MNLHSVWDSKLIETQGFTFEQIATSKKPTTKQIAMAKKFAVKWAWESGVATFDQTIS